MNECYCAVYSLNTKVNVKKMWRWVVLIKTMNEDQIAKEIITMNN